MSPSNAKRELRRNRARRDFLANEIAEAVSAGVAPNPESVRAWRLATMRLYAAQKHLRPRECGSALGEGQTNGTHIPAVEAAGNATQGNAAPTPAPFPNTTQPERNSKP